jgi:hypothetical protein
VGYVGNYAKLKAAQYYRATELGKAADSVVRRADTGVAAPQESQIFYTAPPKLVEPLELTCKYSRVLNG